MYSIRSEAVIVVPSVGPFVVVGVDRVLPGVRDAAEGCLICPAGSPERPFVASGGAETNGTTLSARKRALRAAADEERPRPEIGEEGKVANVRTGAAVDALREREGRGGPVRASAPCVGSFSIQSR
jgi:hypothetical protein